MPLAFAALGGATLLVVSGIKGITLGDVLSGKGTDGKLSPAGGNIDWGAGAPIAVSGNGVSGSVDAGSTLTDKPGGVLSALKAEMDRMDRLHSIYQWGGSHAGYSDNGPWDCSSAVSQALHKVGLLTGPPRVSSLFMAYGSPGPGKRVTIYSNPTHVYMVVDGRTWQWRHRGTAGGWSGPMSAGGYVQRHPAGL